MRLFIRRFMCFLSDTLELVVEIVDDIAIVIIRATILLFGVLPRRIIRWVRGK